MRLRRNKSRRRQPGENKKRSFFADQGTEEKKPFFSGNETIQRKLSVGKKNDAAEHEAESTAQKVMQVQKAEKKEEEKPVQKAEKKEEEPVQKAEKKEEEKPVQKAEKEEEKPVQKAEKKEEEKPVQKAEKKEEEKPVQAKTDPRIQLAAMTEEGEHEDASKPSFENLLAKRKGMGFTLPDDLRKEMEKKFNTSFKKVRIHTDKQAADMCESIHAIAFAHGYDIYFNEGMYKPEALSGRELLAHELTHVVQQNG